MSPNGQVRVLRPESWQHAHTCYTCQRYLDCDWMYCKDQLNRNCAACIRAMQPVPEETP